MNHNEMFEYLKVVSRMERQFYTAFGRDITSERIITMSMSISGLVKVLIDFKERKDFPISTKRCQMGSANGRGYDFRLL